MKLCGNIFVFFDRKSRSKLIFQCFISLKLGVSKTVYINFFQIKVLNLVTVKILICQFIDLLVNFIFQILPNSVIKNTIKWP